MDIDLRPALEENLSMRCTQHFIQICEYLVLFVCGIVINSHSLSSFSIYFEGKGKKKGFKKVSRSFLLSHTYRPAKLYCTTCPQYSII
jgi:hypothetical protein